MKILKKRRNGGVQRRENDHVRGKETFYGAYENLRSGLKRLRILTLQSRRLGAIK